MQITENPFGFQLSQHGVVLSEMRRVPGPTHSVFDVMAALIAVLNPAGRIGILGFAGGSIIAPMRFLNIENTVEAVDIDRTGHDLFVEHCSEWAGKLKWKQADANEWLQRRTTEFDVLVDDLSVPLNEDVVKPECSWSTLPALMKSRVKRGGFVISNQLKPEHTSWAGGMKIFGNLFKEVQVVHLDVFENRILLAGEKLPPVRETSKRLKAKMELLDSELVGLFGMRRFQ